VLAEILWWHWIVLGIFLMLTELVVPAFFLIWFGAAAVAVGLVVAAFPAFPFAWQVVTWTVSSLVLIWLWFKVFKAGSHKTRVGMSQGMVAGEVALVTREIRPYERGEIRFQKPILGAESWESIADEEIKVGERVKVLSVEGNILKVGRI
jgi:membrane protein implicated in regulation of membrane protease activity